jgi:hypothetical protein
MESIDKNIIVCGIPQYDFAQNTEHIIETTPIMNDNNPTTEALTNEQIILNGLVTIGTAKGARTLSTLERIHALNESGMIYTASHAVFNFAKNAGKRLGFTLESDVEFIANLVMSNLDMLIDRISEEKPTKTTRKGGIIDMACMDYAVGVIRGTVLKNARTAKNCKDLALKMLVNPGFDINDLPMSIDSLANKVYASIRSQAKKNGVEIGGKSNTATKNAVKTALIETIEALRLEHGTEYEILIDNMPKQPKHLSV